MMEKFTASNGVLIEEQQESEEGMRRWKIGYAILRHTTIELDALREFFLAKQDEARGVWRSKKNPEYVVYPGASHVRVMHDPSGSQKGYSRLTASAEIDERALVAQEYFQAHPKAKRWHKAKEGEIWELTTEFSYNPGTFLAIVENNHFVYLNRENGGKDVLDSTLITAGKRVWPKGGN